MYIQMFGVVCVLLECMGCIGNSLNIVCVFYSLLHVYILGGIVNALL